MLTALQSSTNPGLINAAGVVFGLGGLAITWLWLRVFYRSSGI